MKTLVIGGGLIGLTSAYVLQAIGEPVTVLEANEGIGLETSYANGGLLTASMSDPWNTPGAYKQLARSLVDPASAMKLRIKAIPSLFLWGLHFLHHSNARRHSLATTANYHLSTYAINKTKSLREQLELEYQSRSVGSLKLFRDKTAIKSSLAIAKSLQSKGLHFKQLNTNELIEFEPAFAPIQHDIAGGLHFPNDESGNAYLFCQALAHEFKQAGGTIQTQTTVQRIVVEKQKMIGVETGQGFLPAKHVVLAAGNQSPTLLKGTGLSLRIKPVKGYSLTLDISEQVLRPSIPVIDDGLHAAATPLGTQLRLAGTAEFTGFDARLDPGRIDNLIHFLKVLYPNIHENIDKEAVLPWAGFRPMSADGKPFIGPSNVKGLYINTGHGHLGWTMAMGSAHLLASFIREQTPDIDPSPFNPLR